MKKLIVIIILLVSIVTINAQPWTVNSSGFEFTMNITGKVKLDGNFIEQSNTYLGVFVGNECRGVVRAIEVNPNDFFYFLTIYSNTVSGEQLSFKFQDSQGTIYDFTQNVLFSSDAIFGSTEAPFIWMLPEEFGLSDFINFYASNQVGETVFDYINKTIVINVSYRATINSFATYFKIPAGASIKIGTVPQISGVTLNDFTNPVIYKIRGANGITTDWKVTISQIYTYPEISSTHSDQVLGDGTVCTIVLQDFKTDVTAYDEGDNDLIITQTPLPGTIISGQINTITLKATNFTGKSDSVYFNVEVQNSISPVITCIGNQVINLPLNQGTYIVSDNEFDPASTYDNCGIRSVTNNFNNLSTLSNAVLLPGLTTITWEIIDINGNTSNCSFSIQINSASGNETINNRSILVFPNPTEGILNINNEKLTIKNIELTDITGKNLSVYYPDKLSTFQIDISTFKNGIYFININTENGTYREKILKIH